MRESTFSVIARDTFRQAFGEPEHIHRAHAPMLRWSIPCDENRFSGGSAHVYLTTDPAGAEDEAHVLVSDPCAGAQEPVFTTTARTLEDVQRVIDRIRERIA